MSDVPRVGTEIAGYRIESLLARGGMSTVYLAEHLRLGRRVALKILASELAGDEAFRERFVRESRTAAAIEHPNIIPIWEAGEMSGVLYIAMRYVQGPDLKGLVQRVGPLPAPRAASIIGQVAGALDAAHARGLIHRDVKPGNILIDPEVAPEHHDHVYLCDFGLTKQPMSHSGLTRTGHFVGTIDYIAPEQVEGRDVDFRADIYSLGCVVYECLTGVVPFVKTTDAAVLWAHVQEQPMPVSERRSDLPSAVDAVIFKAMAKAPEDRYQSCAALVDDFREAVSTVPARTSPPAAATVAAAPAPPPPPQPVAAAGSAETDATRAAERAPQTESISDLPGRGANVRRPIAARRALALAAVIGLVVGVAAGSGASLVLGSSGDEINQTILLAHLPNQDSCHQVDATSPDPSGQLADEDVFAQASCDPVSTVHVDYYLIHDTAWMQVTFYQILQKQGVPVNAELMRKMDSLRVSLQGTAILPPLSLSTSYETCENGTNVATSWGPLPGEPFGHSATSGARAGGVIPNGGLVACWTVEGKKWFAWTDNQTTTLSVASGNINMTTPWWEHDAGPNTEPIAMG